jgi:hypothetical protein
MAEALPVNEQITQQIMETLATVVAGATYKITLIPLRWAKKLPAAAHFQAVLHEGDDNELGDDETPCGFKAWTREYAVQIYVLHQGLAAGQAWGTAKNLARADVERALMVDVTPRRLGAQHRDSIAAGLRRRERRRRRHRLLRRHLPHRRAQPVRTRTFLYLRD